MGHSRRSTRIEKWQGYPDGEYTLSKGVHRSTLSGSQNSQTNVSSGENKGPGNDPVDIWQLAIMLIVNIIYPQASLGAIIYTLLMNYSRGGMIFISSTP